MRILLSYKLIVFVIANLLIWEFSSDAYAQNTPNPTTSVLTIMLRNSHAEVLGAVDTEILSYDWGRNIGQAYTVVAKGVTDVNGVVAFDVSAFPRSSYRIRFNTTPDTKPEGTYIEPDTTNHFRGYPLTTLGAMTEVQAFVLWSGNVYPDLSRGQGLPEWSKALESGIPPAHTHVPSEMYYQTVKIATAKAIVWEGKPTATRPPPPTPFKTVQAALTVTPSAPIPTSTPNDTKGQIVVGAAFNTPPPTQVTSAVAAPKPPVKTKEEPNLFRSILLALFGIGSVVLFWKYRFKVYRFMGVAATPTAKKPKLKANTKRTGAFSSLKTHYQEGMSNHVENQTKKQTSPNRVEKRETDKEPESDQS
jgi:hypothetical protein